MQTPTPSAQVIALEHVRREKQHLFASETDVLRERRRLDRMLDGLRWRDVGNITAECFAIAFMVAGFVWFLNWLLARFL